MQIPILTLIQGIMSPLYTSDQLLWLQSIGQSSPGGISDPAIWGLLIALLAIILFVVTRTLRPQKPEVEEEKKKALPEAEEALVP